MNGIKSSFVFSTNTNWNETSARENYFMQLQSIIRIVTISYFGFKKVGVQMVPEA